MKEKISKFVSREKWLLIFVAVIAVFAYGYMVFNFALTGDEERDLVLGTSYTSQFELPLGRYGQWLFRLIFMEGMMLTPGYGDLLAVLFLAASAVVWCSNFEKMYLGGGIYSGEMYFCRNIYDGTLCFGGSHVLYLLERLVDACGIMRFSGHEMHNPFIHQGQKETGIVFAWSAAS